MIRLSADRDLLAELAGFPWRTDMSPDYVTRLRVEIERRERSKRYCDAVKGQQWFSEMLRREDNDCCLNNACGRLEAALRA
jgi:hypothetical protein